MWNRDRPISLFETIPKFEVEYRPIISVADIIGDRFYRASLIIVKLEFAYRPIFKNSQISADNIGGPIYRSVSNTELNGGNKKK